MLYLFTGQPGHSKTLNAIKMICENKRYEGRTVYYYNLKEVELKKKFPPPSYPSSWVELTKEECLKWYELPDKSVVFIDEAQDIFINQQYSKDRPRSYTETNKHRHTGTDIYLITQAPTLIDKQVRSNAGVHYHFKRPFNGPKFTRIEFQSVQDDVNDFFANRLAKKTHGIIDKNYFDTYKSTVEDTHKANFPILKLSLPVIFLSIALFAGNMVYQRFANPDIKPDIAESEIDGGLMGDLMPKSMRAKSSEKREKGFHAEDYIPRNRNVPWSAPAYDEVYEVKSFPRIAACIHRHSNNQCSCYTQQGTLLDIEKHVCMDIKKRGYFDPTLEDTRDSYRNYNARNSPAVDSALARPAAGPSVVYLGQKMQNDNKL